ncbi:DUF1847 domain-containing protein [Thermosyntropha sp.]|uniref:DUF1847 domain-containing protein n=1 Tax=Thermosyntropha sp. TaxID=2740820 RepID=UPI0025FA53F6|nr:DUF1847 domain-containing protein [Thermosyntropha sp.]MBO8158927.1 DUF1847 domain-containing protein [Thermosyntropha sp.]
MKSEPVLSCTECKGNNCYRRDGKYPDFCLTVNLSEEEIKKVRQIYADEENRRIMQTAAFIEGKYYGQLTRVEETIKFARKMGMNKIGIAACIGLINEARIFARIVRAKGLNPYCVVCKVGSVDKCDFGLQEEMKLKPYQFEAACNPILQAEALNRENTELNVVIGLCVGHDILFNKYSKAPVTTLITKDRVLAHNPTAALYTVNSYYKKLLEEDK